jgi:hypothetical protein
MASKHRHFKKKHERISPYMLWLLCGFLLGHKYQINPKNKRVWTVTLKDGSQLPIQAAAMKNLIDRNFVYIYDKTKLRITGTGFPTACSRVRATGVKLVNGS